MKNLTITESYNLHPSILREYDIRGIVGNTLSPYDAYLIGKAFASYVISNSTNKTIVVARDGRISSPEMCAELIKGLLSAGAEVIDIGLGPTPLLYFAGHILKTAGGVMVTGSHNPSDYNGFKFTFNNKSFYGDDLKLLGNMISEDKLRDGIGREIECEIDIQKIYLLELLDACGEGRELKVAWDPGNGAAGEIVKLLCQKLPGMHILINAEIDGRFPNHHPDPTIEENLEQLANIVIEQGCDFGVAFDGDADRIGIVDGLGRMIPGDQLLGIFAADLLARRPGATIIADVKSSQHLFDNLKLAGANSIMWKTGHSLIKAKMAETGAILAGEMSGHIFFADKYYGFDDGIYAAVRLIDLASRFDFSLAKLIEFLPKSFITKELRIDCHDDRKFNVIEEVKARLKEIGESFNDIDGVRTQGEIGWWLLRASNTQAALVARCEAYKHDDLIVLKKELSYQLSKSGVEFDF